MRRWTFAWAWFVAAVLGMGAKGCSESEKCSALRQSAEAVCKAAPDSVSCAALRQQLESCDVPADPCAECPAGTVCRKTSVHGNRSGDASTWTEGTMVECVPVDPAPPVNCLTHPTCPDGQHCDQGIGCVPDPLPDPLPPVVCPPDTIPQVLDGAVVGCLPYPPPEEPVPACSIDGEPGASLPAHQPALGDEVNAAMTALRPECPVGSRCLLTEGRQAWQAKVVAELRRRGVCAGQHNPGTDEIAVASSPTAPREGWHVYAGAEDGPGTVVWSPGAARLAWSAPVTAPDLPPVPDPPATTCPAPPCPDRAKGRWKIKTKLHSPKIVDNTAVTVDQEPFCRATGMSPMADGTLRAGCPMRPDGHPERSAVEAWVTGGTKLEARNGATCTPVLGNPFQFYRAGGGCRLCSADGLTCGGWF
jgi:hypothetical protein